MYTIILVDDERLTLDTLANYIDWEQMSCRVIATASNGRDALKKIEDLQPDILITDVKMPVMDGFELIGRIRETKPDMKIICMSGYFEGQLPERTTLLEKPFVPEQFRSCVDSILSHPCGGGVEGPP